MSDFDSNIIKNPEIFEQTGTDLRLIRIMYAIKMNWRKLKGNQA